MATNNNARNKTTKWPKMKEPKMELIMYKVGYIANIGKCYIWGVTTLLHYKRISSRDLGLEELRIFGTEVILTLPSSFSVGMVRPLNFEELD